MNVHGGLPSLRRPTSTPLVGRDDRGDDRLLCLLGVAVAGALGA